MTGVALYLVSLILWLMSCVFCLGLGQMVADENQDRASIGFCFIVIVIISVSAAAIGAVA